MIEFATAMKYCKTVNGIRRNLIGTFFMGPLAFLTLLAFLCASEFVELFLLDEPHFRGDSEVADAEENDLWSVSSEVKGERKAVPFLGAALW